MSLFYPGAGDLARLACKVRFASGGPVVRKARADRTGPGWITIYVVSANTERANEGRELIRSVLQCVLPVATVVDVREDTE